MSAALDIVIVNFNTAGDLRACLRSLHEAPPARAHTICVVDNASIDGSQGMVGTGRLVDGVFVATEILARHDETYMPKEVIDALKEQGVYVEPATN